MSQVVAEAPLDLACSAYAQRRLSLLTQHGKERVIGPVLEAALGCRVEHVAGYDTDRLGSFTREIPRAGTQLEAARRKARIGMQLAALPQGLASEGAFGPDPITALASWNVELVILIDDALGVEVVGRAQGPARHRHGLVSTWAELERLAMQAGFPDHWLVLRPDHAEDSRVQKGVRDWAALETAYATARSLSATGSVFVENDLRAHANPTRMAMIRQASEDLARRLQSCCPACGVPGYWLLERLPGRPCADCGAPTREARAELWGCLKCTRREERSLEAGPADPGLCDWCNP